MPRGNQMSKEDQFVKLLLAGGSKAGKTHFAMEAAADGFNVLYFDGDVSRPTIQSFNDSTLNRVWYMDLCDTQAVARMWILIERMFTTAKFMWDDTNQQTLKAADADAVAVWQIELAKMCGRDVLVIDSWTSVVNSIKQQIAKRTGIDLANPSTVEMRELYGRANHMADFILKCILGIRCHVIVTAHPAEYEHKTKPKGLVSDQKEKDMKIEYVKKIPASISNPHGNKMGKYFTDVCWIEPNAMGKRMIDGRPDPLRESGGRFNKIKDTSEYSFKRLVKEAGGVYPEAPDSFEQLSAITEYSVGEYTPPDSSTKGKPVLANRGGTVKL